MSDREQQRNLKREVGRQAADAIVAAQAEVRQMALEHRVLARQMLEFETTVATVRAGRALDREIVGAHTKQLAELTTCREQHANKFIDHRAQIYRDGLRLERLESMTLWQRLRWNVTGRLPTLPDTIADTMPARTFTPRSSTFAQLARDFNMLRPKELNPYVPHMTPAEREAFWQDIGRPASGDPS